MPRGGHIGVGSVDRHPMVRDNVSRLQRNGDFASKIVRRVVGDPLRKSQNL